VLIKTTICYQMRTKSLRI